MSETTCIFGLARIDTDIGLEPRVGGGVPEIHAAVPLDFALSLRFFGLAKTSEIPMGSIHPTITVFLD